MSPSGKETSESAERLRRAIDGSNDGFWDWPDLSDGRQWWSRRYYELIGYEEGEIEPSLDSFLGLMHPSERPDRSGFFAPHAEAVKCLESDFRLRDRQGAYRWFHGRARTHFEDGKPVRASGSIRDISQRKALELELAQYKRLLEQAQRIARIGSWEWNARTYEAVWSRELFTILGRDPALGPPIIDDIIGNVHPDDIVALDRAHEEGLRTGQYEVEYRMRRFDGDEWRVLCAKGKVECNSDGVPLRHYGITIDVTEQKLTEEALKESTQRLALHVAQTPLAVIEWDTRFEVVSWNPAAEAIFGYTADEVIGRRGTIIVPDEYKSAVDAVWENLISQRGGTRSTNDNITKDGRRITCEWYNTTLVDARGRVVGVASHAHDVTARVEAERQNLELERQILQAQKLESLGVLAGGIAHDFNNLLAGVLGNATLALMDVPETSNARTCIEEIERSATRAADLCRQMLAYSGRGKFMIEPIELGALVREMMDLLRSSISRSARLSVEVEDRLPVVHGDATQLRQIIMNLLVNASEAIGSDAGRIDLRLRTCDLDDETLRAMRWHEAAQAGPFVCLEVVDDGCGMGDETLARMFEPFFTTKFTGRGLGMSAVQGIVRGHRGALEVESAPGKGSVFRVYFPAAVAGESEHPDSPLPLPGEPHATGTVMLVDDEPSVRNLGRRMLAKLGYDVVLASDGEEAVALYGERGSTIDLVLLDLTMPGIGGEEALRRLRELDPRLPVVISSGYSEHEVSSRFEDAGLSGFLQKPYSLDTLAKTMRSAFTR